MVNSVDNVSKKVFTGGLAAETTRRMIVIRWQIVPLRDRVRRGGAAGAQRAAGRPRSPGSVGGRGSTTDGHLAQLTDALRRYRHLHQPHLVGEVRGAPRSRASGTRGLRASSCGQYAAKPADQVVRKSQLRRLHSVNPGETHSCKHQVRLKSGRSADLPSPLPFRACFRSQHSVCPSGVTCV